MTIKEWMADRVLLLDGGIGTLLQAAGLRPGELPERWNLTRPETVQDIHRAYLKAGSRVITTNTFGANTLKFEPEELKAVVSAAVQNARTAITASGVSPAFVALDIGPTGRLLRPFGDLDFEEAVGIFAQTVRLGAAAGADLVLIETMNDSYETKAALLAAKENCDLPVFVCNAYGEDGKLMTGASPAAMVALLEGMGADAIGVNCSFGPDKLEAVTAEYLQHASVPVILKPNAGLPRSENGQTVFDIGPDDFAAQMAAAVTRGVRMAGGCCGTTPVHIAALAQAVSGLQPLPQAAKTAVCISSFAKTVTFGEKPVLIGERINPTGKKRLKQALTEGDMAYVLSEGVRQQERGAEVLDVNVGVPGLDEPALLTRAVTELQAVTELPLQIDTADPAAMERALRRYNGKALVNSVNGKAESMAAVFPLIQKYGGVVIALTLDENGIPATADGRVAIAEKILRTAAKYGLGRRDLIFDPLAMPVSADKHAALVTLEALRRIRDELHCLTSLGVSNVSFGLPARPAINSAFFTAAMENGLAAAILNPDSDEMLLAYHTFCALHGLDENCAGYIAFCEAKVDVPAAPKTEAEPPSGSALQRAIVKGLREQAGDAAAALLQSTDPLALIREEIIPALDTVGRGFEAKTVYLPQLLMSAEAAGAAFGKVKAAMEATRTPGATRCRFVLATVQGDIHDIGKNIVRLLLENYGFAVTDLGRDVPPETVAETVVSLHAPLVGLSALMTTTVPAMEATIRLLREKAPWCRIVVGGAVLTAEYAAAIGADKYARDAMETLRYAEENDR